MEFIWRLTAGDLLMAITLVVSAFGLYNRISIQIVRLEEKIDPLYTWWVRRMENLESKQMGD